jgi:hypothetical protein
MTLWKVVVCYPNNDKPMFVVLPYDLIRHLRCCFKWYGLNGLKWCYLFCRQAEKKAEKLNRDIRKAYRKNE